MLIWIGLHILQTAFSHSHLTQGNVPQPSAVGSGISAFNLCNSKLMVLHSLISV